MSRHCVLPANRCDDCDRVFDRIKNQDQCRADEDSVRNADAILARWRQILDQSHDIVAEITEHAGRHRGQHVGKGDAAFGEKISQRGEGCAVECYELVWLGLRGAIDFRSTSIDAEYDIRLQADNRIAASDGAVFDRLQEETRWQ